MTGHLGGNLTTLKRQILVSKGDPAGMWSWSLSYTKFRGRGLGATEKKLGADGIFELVLDNQRYSQRKSMLFQSKMHDADGSRKLITQCAKLSTWREAAAVFSYGERAFEAFTLDTVLEHKGRLKSVQGISLAQFLGNTFVDCLVGDTDLRYDAQQKLLTWTDARGLRVGTKFSVKQRFKVTVQSPVWVDSSVKSCHIIENEEIHNHRMQVNVDDLLNVSWNATTSEKKKAKRALAMIYHPDHWSQYPLDVRNAMTARAREILEVDIPQENKLTKQKAPRRARDLGD